MRRSCLASVVSAVLLLVPAARADEMTFDFADPKGVNGITFILDSQLEPFVGIGGGVSGSVMFDPEHPEGFAGSIRIATDKLQLVSDRMNAVMQGADWLNIGDNTDITVTFGEVQIIVDDDEEDIADSEENDADDAGVRLQVQGVLTFGSIHLEKTFEIHVTYIPDGGTERGGGQGDLLVIRSEFVVSRYDLGIKLDMGTDKVADEVWVIVPIVGYSK